MQEESEVRWIPCLQVNFKSPLPLFDVLIAIEHHWVSLSHSQKIASLFEISAIWSVSWLNSAKCGVLRCFEHFFGSPRWSFEASKDISGSGNSEAASAYAGASGDATKSTTTEDSMAGRAPRQQLAPCIFFFCQKTYRFYEMGNLLHVCPFFASLNWTAKITARSMVKIRPGGWQISWEGFCLCTHSWETQILWSAGASRWPGWGYGDLTRMHAICMLVC